FHNDNSVAVLRDIPGLLLAVPTRADDALEIFRNGLHLAKAHGRVVTVLEPIALYHTRDLLAEGDGQWLAHVPQGSAESQEQQVTSEDDFARARVYHEAATDLTILTYGNGVWMALRA